MAASYEVHGLTTIPDLGSNMDLVAEIVAAADREKVGLQPGDLVVVSSKAAAKCQGRLRDLHDIRPTRKALAIHRLTGKDARWVQAVLEECESVVGYVSTRRLARDLRFLEEYFGGADASSVLENVEAVLLTRMADGSLATDAGTDRDNLPGRALVCMLPVDPAGTARTIREGLQETAGGALAVILSDTEVRTMRYGTADIALGWSGIRPISSRFGSSDLYGNPKFGGVDAVADQAANAAVLLMGQTSARIPVVILRGLEYEKDEEGSGARLSMPLRYQSRFVRNTYRTWIQVRLALLFRRFF